jgi:hypothetical protein
LKLNYFWCVFCFIRSVLSYTWALLFFIQLLIGNIMYTLLRKTISIGLPLLACSAQAFPFLPGLTNLDFTQYTGTAPKAPFTSVNPVGWSGGNGLIFIDSNVPAQSAAGPVYLQTYGNPGILSGPAYNYVEADGNPSFESSFNHQLTGLTPGQTYTLSFYQAAS